MGEGGSGVGDDVGADSLQPSDGASMRVGPGRTEGP